jgi:hypothetical protein
MRPAADERAEEMWDQTNAPASVIHDAWQLSEAPVLKSSGRAEGPFPYPTHLPPVRGVIPTAEMNRIAPWPSAWISHDEADPSATGTDQLPTASGFPTQHGPGTGTSYPYPPHAPRVHPLGFSPPHMPGMSNPRRASSLDTAMLPVGVHGQSMLSSMPVPMGYMGTHRYPPSSLNSGPLDAPPLDQSGGPYPVRGPSGFPSPDSNNKGDSTYLLHALVADKAHCNLVIPDPGGG